MLRDAAFGCVNPFSRYCAAFLVSRVPIIGQSSTKGILVAVAIMIMGEFRSEKQNAQAVLRLTLSL